MNTIVELNEKEVGSVGGGLILKSCVALVICIGAQYVYNVIDSACDTSETFGCNIVKSHLGSAVLEVGIHGYILHNLVGDFPGLGAHPHRE